MLFNLLFWKILCLKNLTRNLIVCTSAEVSVLHIFNMQNLHNHNSSHVKSLEFNVKRFIYLNWSVCVQTSTFFQNQNFFIVFILIMKEKNNLCRIFKWIEIIENFRQLDFKFFLSALEYVIEIVPSSKDISLKKWSFSCFIFCIPLLKTVVLYFYLQCIHIAFGKVTIICNKIPLDKTEKFHHYWMFPKF